MTQELDHLIVKLEEFFRFVADLGDNRANFDFGIRDEGDEAVLEITYRPTGVTRWYDANVLKWSLHAMADFRRGKFHR